LSLAPGFQVMLSMPLACAYLTWKANIHVRYTIYDLVVFVKVLAEMTFGWKLLLTDRARNRL
jgi:hypothetical protein